MKTNEIGPKFQVEQQSAYFGEFVSLKFWQDRGLLSPQEAEELGMALIVAAARARENAVEPPTRLLPFVQPWELERSLAAN